MAMPPRPSCWLIAKSASPSSSDPNRSTSRPPFRAPPPARSSAASSHRPSPPPRHEASERSERATRSERAGEAARESACRGVRGAKPLGQKMRIVIAGAGAIGGYIGARLARAGADVVLFARGPHLQAMQSRGLRVTSGEGDFEVRPQVTGDLSTIGTADVVFLGVKAHGLTALAPALRPLFGPDTIVVSTQNGIPWWYF